MSGKTIAACRLIRDIYRPAGIRSAVLDCNLDPKWQQHGADFVTDDAEKFLYVVRKNRRLAVFVDEAGETLDRNNPQHMALATRYRHLGHQCHFISQRFTGLAPTIRSQCGGLFLFRSCAGDVDELEKIFPHDLRAAVRLGVGEYLYCTTMEPPRRGQLFKKSS